MNPTNGAPGNGMNNQNNQDSYYQSSNRNEDNMSAGSGEGSANYKSRRRSKKDNEGRNFKCDKCDKTYLSYPALYTHTKLKHSDGNDGKPVLPVFSGRGRGRPRKNTKRVDPTTDEYFKSDGREGGPSNPIHGFKEVLDEFNYEKYLTNEKQFPLYKYLERFAQIGGFIETLTDDIHNKEDVKLKEVDGDNPAEDSKDSKAPGAAGTKEEEGKTVEQSKNALDEPLFIDPNSKAYLNRDPANLTEDDKSAVSCDEVFAIYLYETSRKTNPDYYKIMLRFIIAYRECLNRYGWEKKAENDEVLNNAGNGDEMETTMITPASESIQEKAKELKRKACGLEFSYINNAEHAPEICNEFVTVFLQDNKETNLQKNESIDLTRNICHWLFAEGYTCSKVSMIKC
jgi:hypothetical protein